MAIAFALHINCHKLTDASSTIVAATIVAGSVADPDDF
jgi:hypothetical protein